MVKKPTKKKDVLSKENSSYETYTYTPDPLIRVQLEDKPSFVHTSFYQLLALYALLILAIAFSFISQYTIHFEIAALIIALLGLSIVTTQIPTKSHSKLHFWLFILAIVLIIALRAMYYVSYDIPLGYDAGLYKYAIDHGVENKDQWILSGGMEPGFLYLMSFLALIFSSNFLITAGYIFSIVCLGLAVYICTRTYFGSRAAIISLIIYSVSAVQYLVFTYLYYKNVIGLTFMLLALALVKRMDAFEKPAKSASRLFFIVFAVVLAWVHRPTFFIFGLTYFVYAFTSVFASDTKGKKLLVNIITGSIILAMGVLPYIGPFWPAVASMFSPVLGSIAQPGESPGTFISFTSYQLLSLPYLVLALLGFFAALKTRKAFPLVIWTIINAAIVYFQLFFFNRFIIHLDIVCIMLAGLGASYVLEHKKRLGPWIVIILLIASLAITFKAAAVAHPIIGEQNLLLMKQVSSSTEPDSLVISISKEYSPWILAYSQRKTIAPGLFDYDRWTEEQWNEFWYATTERETKELLNLYNPEQQPIYLFVGTKNFTNPCFQTFLQTGESKVARYVCS